MLVGWKSGEVGCWTDERMERGMGRVEWIEELKVGRREGVRRMEGRRGVRV